MGVGQAGAVVSGTPIGGEASPQSSANISAPVMDGEPASNPEGEEKVETGADTKDVASISPKPEGGHDKYYDKKTGEYDWKSHSIEIQYKLDQAKKRATKSDGDPKGEDGSGKNTEGENISLDLQAIAEEWSATGEISAETKQSIVENHSIPAEMIDQYIQGQEALARVLQLEQNEFVGGEEKRKSLLEWARDNMSSDEIELIDGQLVDRSKYKMALTYIQSMRRKALGTDNEPGDVLVSDAGQSTGEVYSDRKEWLKDMSSKRYASDEKFRQYVMNKAIRSKLHGV